MIFLKYHIFGMIFANFIKKLFLGMFRITALLLFLWLSSNASTILYHRQSVLEEIEKSFRAGSARDLSRFFNQMIELSLDGKRANYSKAQAEFIMRDFFKNYPPDSEGIEVVHQGSYQGALVYSIMRYQSQGKPFRVFIKLKEYQKRLLIDSITLSQE